MKANKKALALVLCALMLVAASVFGTLAYLVDTDNQVTNTFTVGNVVITLDEAEADVNGVVEDPDDRVYGNQYKLMPGHKYTKDPTVHIDPSSEDCYVFVKITNDIANIEDSAKTIAAQMTAKGWHLVKGQTDVYYYGASAEATDAAVVKANANLIVFEEFTIAGGVDYEVLSDYSEEDITIDIIAYAIQADGFEAAEGVTVAEKAWAALYGQMNPNP